MLRRSKLEAELEQLKNMAKEIRRLSPSLIGELKDIVRNPRALGAMIEERSPWLSRRFLGAASNIAEPFLAGMGLRVERLTEESIEVSMPDSWRNQGEGGLLHTGALSTLGEFASRLYWEHHLDLKRSEMNPVRVHLRVLGRPKGDVRAAYRISVGEREKILHALRASGQTGVECEVSIHDAQEKLLAQVEVEWQFARPLALGAGSGARS